MKNSEGYPDPTAGKAIYQADKLPKPIADVIHILRLDNTDGGIED